MDLYQSGNAELVALYGRRRVGKTYLVDETFGNKITFRHSGLSPVDGNDSSKRRKSPIRKQLEHFHRSLVMHGMKERKLPESWQDAFYMLEDYLIQIEKDQGDQRILVFLDEIQWLDTPRSGFMTGFEAFWNGWACHKHNVMVIVCGSSSSWILDKFINNHGGLYNRVTFQIYLAPFTLNECEQYFISNGLTMSRYDVVQAYMTVGGIPYYLRLFKKGKSISQNIESIFFEKNAPLKEEFDRLFSSLFSNPEVMKSIITAAGSKNRGLSRNELAKAVGVMDSGEFSRILKALISGDFIIKYRSFGNDKKEEFYKLADPFCIFWLRFVKGSISRSVSWTGLNDSGSVISWKGCAFENVCWNHIPQIKKALGISGVTTFESMWSKRGDEDSEGTQIDLIIERKDNVVNMCEIKFYSDEFTVTKDYHFTIMRREKMLKELLPKKASVHSVLITTFGLKPTEYYGDFANTVLLDDLFQ